MADSSQETLCAEDTPYVCTPQTRDPSACTYAYKDRGSRRVHEAARKTPYGCSPYVARFRVPDHRVSWTVPFPGYSPHEFTHSILLKMPPWAEQTLDPKKILFNTYDRTCGVDRRSSTDEIIVDCHGYPMNPDGRTGLRGRGVLGRFGPNHAADAIMTRWARNDDNEVVTDTDGKPVMQFVAIKRADTGEWALPGGMINPHASALQTAVAEFCEEALDSLQADKDTFAEVHQQIKTLFYVQGKTAYKGYVDDPRNTDNAWMETTALHYHDATGEETSRLTLKAGDDAVSVAWVTYSASVPLYANHAAILAEAYVRAVKDLPLQRPL